MKKKKVFSKSLAIVLVLSLMLSASPNLSVFAQEVSSKEKLTEKGELWQPELNSNALNFEGDLSIEELQSAKLSDEDTPEIVGQDNIEEKGHVNRLWEQEEDLNSIVFQNRDGTKTMYYYNYPVKYKDANGKIKDKSNKISKTSSGDFTNAENDINTYFPKKLNRNKGIELKFGEYVVEMAPDIKGNSGASRQTGHNKYFEPTEYVQYPNVFDESISLRYTPTFEGYKEDIVLSKYVGINEFSFHLYTDGLSLVMDEDGTYCLADPLSGEVKTQIGDLVVYDSKPFEAPDKILNESVSNPTEEDYAKKEAILKAAEKNAAKESSSVAKTYSHQYKVKTVKQDNEYLITIIVDEDYLTDKERVYPVYVDPTISVSGSGTGKTIQDAPIYSARPNYTHSDNEYNVVGYAGYWKGAEYGIGRTLMKFPGLISNSTYANLPTNQITSLELHIYEGSGNPGTSCIDLWQYTGTSWTESTARCGNIGWDSYTNNFTWNYINSSGWQTFDLTSMVETWKGSDSALDKGIMLKNYTSEFTSGYSKHFMSTESSCKPYLEFTYNSATYSTLTLNQSKSGYIEQGGEYWYKFTAPDCKTYTFLTEGSTNMYGELYQGSTLLKADNDSAKARNFGIAYTLTTGVEYRIKVRGYSSSTTGDYSIKVTVLDDFNYNSTTYNYDLALKCSEYAMLAYQTIELNSSGFYFDNSKSEKKMPEALIDELGTDNFSNIDSYNYKDDDEHNVSYTLAEKLVTHNGQVRNIVAIIIRGTNGDEWKGNMDVTGTSYDSSINNHYSFKAAETDLRINSSNGLSTYISKNNINNPIYMIAGHSRGAAVANLLAETLNLTVGTNNVYAYTFATPNNTKVSNTARNNIYNFCFNDDFVPQVPLSSWGYGKHGITYTETAENLYSNYISFKNDMDRFVTDSRGKTNAVFNLSATSSLLMYVSFRWTSVQEYYEEVHMSGVNSNETLYTFFRGTVAPAAMGGFLATVELLAEAIGLIHTEYTTIASFFVSGSGAVGYDDFVYNAHSPFTYYTAVKYGLFF